MAGFLSSIFGGGGEDPEREEIPDAPALQDLQLQLNPYVFGGEFNPQDTEFVEQGPSAYETLEEDPRLRGSQLDALAQLEGIVGAGGLDARGEASIEDAIGRQRTASRGGQDAILAETRARGIGGSGIETVGRLLAQQGAATRGAREGLDVAALREERRDQALRDQAGLAGNIREQDFSNGARRADAADAISRFNAANRQSVNQNNVDARNQAGLINTRERQRISDENVDTRNQQEIANRVDTPLRRFGIQRGVTSDRNSNAEADAAREERRRQQQTQNILTTVGTAASFFSDERAKEDVKPIDSRAMLAELSGHEYEYKDPSMGEGRQVGVMAQDLERSPFAGAVEEDEETGLKKVDGGKLAGSTLGILADLNRRLSMLEDSYGG